LNKGKRQLKGDRMPGVTDKGVPAGRPVIHSSRVSGRSWYMYLDSRKTGTFET